MLVFLIFCYIKTFKDLVPSVRFKIKNLSREDSFERLLNDDIDFFIYLLLRKVPDELEFISVAKYKPILLTHKDHPLSKKKNITLQDISKYELLRIDPKFITLPAFEELLKAHKIFSNIEFEMSDWKILKKFVKANIGVAMISNIVLEGEDEKDLTQRDLTKYFPEMDYGIFIKKGKNINNLLKNFIGLMASKKLLDSQG
jgi:DNA-binding transcriptional LysR family regulator